MSTGDWCSVACSAISNDDLYRTKQDGNPYLKDPKVKLLLLKGSLMIPVSTVSLEVENNNNQCHTMEVLKFQIARATDKPSLSADTSEKLGLLQLNINNATKQKRHC